MKNNKRVLLLFTSMSALTFLILFNPSFTLAENSNSHKSSVASKSIEQRKTNAKQDTEPNPNPEPSPEPEPEPNLPPNPPEPESGEKPDENTSKPEQDKDLSPEDTTSKPSEKTKPTPKPETSNPKTEATKDQNSKRNQNSTNSNRWNNQNRNNGTIIPPKETINTQPANNVQSISDDQNDLPVEEVESEDIKPIEEDPKMDLAQYSLKELIEMIENGEVSGEVINDKYFVISKETKERREVTEQEALELGMIEAEEIEKPTEETEETEEDASEVIVEPAPVAIKSERSKTPIYISAVGMVTIIIGSLMYFLQIRRNRD